MGIQIKINHALKKYGEVTVIPDLNLDVKQGEFFTLLGPSGCGKTTLLRMIAGFNTIEGGDFYFNDKRINDIDASKRNIGMVFQNYAIFPNMTVRKNVEFGLKNRKKEIPELDNNGKAVLDHKGKPIIHYENYSKNEINELTNKFLKLVHVDQYADRMPSDLSGGQQQRVALARALVISPDVLLMDEPLSNLDAKLRVEMRSAIKEIQHNVGITTIYVTHDQEEAMSVSDRIAVMYNGVIQHIGTPKAIYQRPANKFVSTFIGRSNVLNGKLIVENKKTYIVFDDYKAEMTNIRDDMKKNQNIIISVRPEELLLDHKENDKNCIFGKVEDAVFLGLNTTYFVELSSKEKVIIIQESKIDSTIEPGTKISLTFNTEKLNIFTEDGSINLVKGVKNDLELNK